MDSTTLTNNIINCIKGSIPLAMAKELMQEVEDFAKSKGLACVVAVDDAHGNPIAVHVMEGAYLVSFDVATRKAYTAAAVKMSTMELQKLVQPGGTFYGLESLEGGKLVTFGGGIPLKIGETIVAALGISGGTGEQDNEIAEYGSRVFAKLTGQA